MCLTSGYEIEKIKMGGMGRGLQRITGKEFAI
jgi:hypothetical protein